MTTISLSATANFKNLIPSPPNFKSNRAFFLSILERPNSIKKITTRIDYAAQGSSSNVDEGSHKQRKPAMNAPRRKRKPSYGTSRRSVLKKSFTQEQVNFTGSFSNDPVIGIIGGGIAGLICALYLEKRGIRSTVFDTGLHGLGGRMGTRIIDPQQLMFDHAAQFFTVSDPEFSGLVDLWAKKGLVKEWQGMVGELEAGGIFTPLPNSPPRYVGVNGMRPLADSILSETCLVNVVRPCWVSTLEPFNGMWYLSENGKPCGQFDAIVIAHNGKCANRLLASSGLPLIARQMKKLELSSIWALLAAFDDPLPTTAGATAFPFEGAFVKGVDSISWMANNTRKLLGSCSRGPHCWTILSTATFGKQNKVPQESIPTSTAERVKEAMLMGVESALGISQNSIQTPIYTRVQLWGAALPTNSPNIPCIFDPLGRAGICGDWLLGSSLEAAAMSGMALANHIADYFQSDGNCPEEFAVGLHSEFKPLEGHDIGQFPGLKSEQINDTQPVQLLKQKASEFEALYSIFFKNHVTINCEKGNRAVDCLPQRVSIGHEIQGSTKRKYDPKRLVFSQSVRFRSARDGCNFLLGYLVLEMHR